MKQQIARLKSENQLLKSEMASGGKKRLTLGNSSKYNAQPLAVVNGAHPTSSSSTPGKKPYREIGKDGQITELRGWFVTDKEVKALYHSPDRMVREKFRRQVRSLCDDERNAFYQKPTATKDQFVINPKFNDSLNYAYQGDAARKKAERKKLSGHSCWECDNVREPNAYRGG